MPIQSLTIGLNDEKIYYPGELLCGHCQVEVCDEPVQITSFIVKIHGIAKVSWSESFATADHSGSHGQVHTVWYIDSQTLVTKKQEIFVHNGIMQPGIHKLSFALQLKPNLPSSFDGTYGNIRYWLEAMVKPPCKGPKFFQPFKVLQPIDLNTPEHLLPVEGSDSMQVLCCFRNHGPLKITMKTDRSAYTPDDVVVLTGTIENNLSRKAKPFVKLVQKQTIHVRGGRSKVHVQSWPLTPLDVSIDGTSDNLIRKNSVATWLRKQFRIPELNGISPSATCSIIQISYYLEVGVSIPKTSTNLSLRLPVFVGTAATRKFRCQPPTSSLATTEPSSSSSSETTALQGSSFLSSYRQLFSLSVPSSETSNNNRDLDVLPSYLEALEAFNLSPSSASSSAPATITAI